MDDTLASTRDRIYAHYLRVGATAAPRTIADLASRAAHLNRVIRHHFPPDRNARIVDLGCGHGALIHFAHKAGYRDVTGIDRASDQVAAAKALGIDGVGEGDLMDNLRASPDDSLDAIIAFDVIEHFTKDELIAFVDEIRRALKPGGRWIIHAPNGASPWFGRIRYGDFTHEQAFTRESLGQLLLASGFSKVACFEDAPFPHGAKSAARWLIWKLIRAGLRLYLAAETGDLGRGAIFTQNLFAVAVK